MLSPVQYLPKNAFQDDFPLADEIASGPDELLQGASLLLRDALHGAIRAEGGRQAGLVVNLEPK